MVIALLWTNLSDAQFTLDHKKVTLAPKMHLNFPLTKHLNWFMTFLSKSQGAVKMLVLKCSTASLENVSGYCLPAKWSGIQWILRHLFGSEKLKCFNNFKIPHQHASLMIMTNLSIWLCPRRFLRGDFDKFLSYTFQAASTWQAINISVPA